MDCVTLRLVKHLEVLRSSPRYWLSNFRVRVDQSVVVLVPTKSSNSHGTLHVSTSSCLPSLRAFFSAALRALLNSSRLTAPLLPLPRTKRRSLRSEGVSFSTPSLSKPVQKSFRETKPVPWTSRNLKTSTDRTFLRLSMPLILANTKSPSDIGASLVGFRRWLAMRRSRAVSAPYRSGPPNRCGSSPRLWPSSASTCALGVFEVTDCTLAAAAGLLLARDFVPVRVSLLSKLGNSTLPLESFSSFSSMD
mmetsp:Transcript_6754/g.15682  ORF Transcript_6754/g.15682 Transcript_6754/m.15682 type:complete len:249 (+) Transcript_6754:615-1361(+)